MPTQKSSWKDKDFLTNKQEFFSSYPKDLSLFIHGYGKNYPRYSVIGRYPWAQIMGLTI